jgi:glycogen operon protein
LEDVAWFLADGAEMTEEQWTNGFAKSLGCSSRPGFEWVGERGETIYYEQLLDDIQCDL